MQWPLYGRHFNDSYFRSWPASDPEPLAGTSLLDFSLVGHLERVIHFDPKIPDGALELRVPEEQLHGTKVLRAAIDQGGLGASQRVGPVGGGIETDLSDPPADNSSI